MSSYIASTDLPQDDDNESNVSNDCWDTKDDEYFEDSNFNIFMKKDT